ncbi:MAG: aminotransferase class I/II-fold pyridoxal phosphate-dependent enzyme, partial [Candidatus Methanomethyliaceae archaeon]
MRVIHQIEPYITEAEVQAVTAYLRSGGWLTEFRKTAEFEEMIASFLGSRFAVVVTSGTAALYLSLLALGIGPGDSVVVPDFTMIATANAVKWAGAEVILCDIERSTLCLDLQKVK